MEAAWCTGPAVDRRRYRVETPEPLAGGQSYVFDAGTARGDRVALKLIGPVDDAGERQLRDRWARVIGNRHPHLARPVELFRGPGLFPVVGDVPPDADSDLLYAASEWTEGRALRSIAPLPLAAVATVVADLGAALAHLHVECGLLHRDVHPGNVVVSDAGRATLIDLGAVRPDDGGTGASATVAGLLGFIAPELLHGPADRRSDQWSLAMTVVFAVLGRPGGRQSDAELRRELRAALAGAADPERAVRLLLQGVATDPTLRPSSPAAWSSQLAAALVEPAPVPPRRHRLLAAAIAVVLASGVVAAVADDPDPPAERTGAPTSIDECADDQPSPEVEAALAGDCILGAVSLFADAFVHQVHDGVVLDSPDAVVRLTTAQWISYREIAGRSQPTNAASFGGYPTRVTSVADNVEITLSKSGLILGPRADTQSFWLAESVLAVWTSNPGLGLPMTNPYFAEEGVRQDFANGYILLAPEALPVPNIDPSQLIVHYDTDPGAPLAGLDLPGHIVRQPTGTSWYVDADGQRRWIPSAEVYGCAGGDAALIADDVVGSAIATLPLGPPMTC